MEENKTNSFTDKESTQSESISKPQNTLKSNINTEWEDSLDKLSIGMIVLFIIFPIAGFIGAVVYLVKKEYSKAGKAFGLSLLAVFIGTLINLSMRH